MTYLAIVRHPIGGEIREQYVSGETREAAATTLLRRKWLAQWLAQLEGDTLTIRLEAQDDVE